MCPPSETEGEQLGAVADASAAAAGAGGHPAALLQRPAAPGRRHQGGELLRVLRPPRGVRGQGQRSAAPLLRPGGHRKSQVGLAGRTVGLKTFMFVIVRLLLHKFVNEGKQVRLSDYTARCSTV